MIDHFPEKLNKKLNDRKKSDAVRKLSIQNDLVDFSSNDYLGFSRNKKIFKETHKTILNSEVLNGATGSRLLSGNHELHEEVEQQLASFFNAETALLFNSGYDANVGLLSSILQRGDIIFYDEYIHASIRDGVQMSNAKSFKFKHNDFEDLENKILHHSKLVSGSHNGEMYIVTESVFSMDGESPDLKRLSKLCVKRQVHLIVDEAHATGVFGEKGCGLVKELGLEKEVFARVHTFGKALGCHGAAVLGSDKLRDYLINFARSFIYTTATPLHTVANIKVAFEQLVILKKSEESHAAIQKLHSNIAYFNQQLHFFSFGEISKGQWGFIQSDSAIHCCIISGNEKVKFIAKKLQENGFDVKPILSPTVPEGEERLRICLHSYNSKQEIDEVLKLLAIFVA